MNPKRNEITAFLSNDDALRMLKTIDTLNPISLPTNKLCTIKQVSDEMGLPLIDTWKMVDQAYGCGLITFYGGLLSRKRLDLTEIGERFCECTTANDVKVVLDAI